MKRTAALVMLTVLLSVSGRLPGQKNPYSPGTIPENRLRFPPEIILSDPMRDVLKLAASRVKLKARVDG
jgi:hypothetical protein